MPPFLIFLLGAGAAYAISKALSTKAPAAALPGSTTSNTPPASVHSGSFLVDTKIPALAPAGKDTDLTGIMPTTLAEVYVQALASETTTLTLHDLAERLFAAGYQIAASRFYNKIAAISKPDATWPRGDMSDLKGASISSDLKDLYIPAGPFGFSSFPFNGLPRSVSPAELSNAYQRGFGAGATLGFAQGKLNGPTTPDPAAIAASLPATYADTPYQNILDEVFVAGAQDAFSQGYAVGKSLAPAVDGIVRTTTGPGLTSRTA